MYYCTQGNKWVEKTTSSDDNVYFYEDTAVLGFDYEDPNVTGYRSKMILMDIMGNLNEIAITGDLGWNWGSDNYINEGISKDKFIRQLTSATEIYLTE